MKVTMSNKLNSEQLYKNEVNKHQSFSDLDIEKSLIKVHNGNTEELNTILFSFQRMVMKIALKFKYIDKVDFMDLIQEGNLGLLKAIKTYNSTKKTKFSTYAYRLIYTSIIDCIKNQAYLITIPSYAINKVEYTINLKVEKSL